MPAQTILVIDDELVFRDALTTVLTNAGYRALSAADGREAVALIDHHETIDLLIVDLCLPDISGVDLISTISRRKLPIKIIAASGVFDDTQLEIAKFIGANEALRKPAADTAPADSWLATVKRLLGETRVESRKNPLQTIVLLVDDDSSVRGSVRALLNKQGYQVLEAANGVDALAIFQRLGGAIDLLLTDIQMPRIGGRELANSIRTKCPNIPVVYISGDNLHDELHDPKNSKIFVSKPFPAQALLKAVRELLP